MAQVFSLVAGSEGCVKFGYLLRAFRLRSDLNMKDIAAQAEISISFVGMIESGNRAPSRNVASAMLSVMRDQDYISWSEDGEILLLTDPTTKKQYGFTFAQSSRGRRSEGSEETQKAEKIPTVLVRDEHIRLECLKAAVRMNPEMSVFNETIIERAKFFENYVRGN